MNALNNTGNEENVSIAWRHQARSYASKTEYGSIPKMPL